MKRRTCKNQEIYKNYKYLFEKKSKKLSKYQNDIKNIWKILKYIIDKSKKNFFRMAWFLTNAGKLMKKLLRKSLTSALLTLWQEKYLKGKTISPDTFLLLTQF